MTSDDIIALVSVAVPTVTGLIGLFIPSPGPAVVRYSSAWWSSLVQIVAKAWQAKPTQAVEAANLSPATIIIINQAVAAAIAALNTPPPANVWLAPNPPGVAQ